MITPRFYQEECVTGFFEYFRTHPVGNPLAALPPAAGKSIIIALFIQRALNWWPQTRILNLVHVRELISQTHKKLIELWPTAPAGIYSAGLNRRDIGFPITFAGIASVANRIEDFGHIDLVIIDEADMVSHKEETQYRKCFEKLKEANPAVRFIGLTGTPFRLGLGLLTDGGVFTDTIIDYCEYEKFNVLMDAGFLCPLIPKRTDTELDVSAVHMRGGEFVQSELQDAVDIDRVTRAAITESVTLAHDRNHWLCFATGIKHANNVCAELNRQGVLSLCVHTDMPSSADARAFLLSKGILGRGDSAREMYINAFTDGHIRCMVGCGVFGVGFDAPEVDCIVMLRPTGSARIWVQYCGRGLRPHPSKRNCLILDFARNTVRLGPINDPTLPRKPGQKGRSMTPFKICGECATYAHTRSLFCLACGWEFPIPIKIVQKASESELIRRDREPSAPKPPRPPKPPPPPAQVETFRVDTVHFAPHKPRDPSKPITLKISYMCGLRIINEFLSLENEKGFPKHKAREAWRQMGGGTPPDTVEEALGRTGELNPPREIRVLQTGKYPDIVRREYGEARTELEFEAEPISYATAEDDNIPF